MLGFGKQLLVWSLFQFSCVRYLRVLPDLHRFDLRGQERVHVIVTLGCYVLFKLEAAMRHRVDAELQVVELHERIVMEVSEHKTAWWDKKTLPVKLI